MRKSIVLYMLAALTALLPAVPTGEALAASVWVPPGPAIGSKFPDHLALQDQAGMHQSIERLLGKNGVAVFFVRSADWCPFCKKQLVDVNQRLSEFKALGLNVISVSHDEVPVIAAFHQSQSIGYTMLADPDGAVVEKLGVRDLQYSDGSKAYGVARPMIFIVNPHLKITHKFAEQSYRDRPDLNVVLAELRLSKPDYSQIRVNAHQS